MWLVCQSCFYRTVMIVYPSIPFTPVIQKGCDLPASVFTAELYALCVVALCFVCNLRSPTFLLLIYYRVIATGSWKVTWPMLAYALLFCWFFIHILIYWWGHSNGSLGFKIFLSLADSLWNGQSVNIYPSRKMCMCKVEYTVFMPITKLG